MSLRSPLKGAQPNSISACGRLLTDGQAITVADSAIGPRERAAERKGKLLIRPSNKKGQVQVVCTLKGN